MYLWNLSGTNPNWYPTEEWVRAPPYCRIYILLDLPSLENWQQGAIFPAPVLIVLLIHQHSINKNSKIVMVWKSSADFSKCFPDWPENNEETVCWNAVRASWITIHCLAGTTALASHTAPEHCCQLICWRKHKQKQKTRTYCSCIGFSKSYRGDLKPKLVLAVSKD